MFVYKKSVVSENEGNIALCRGVYPKIYFYRFGEYGWNLERWTFLP